jgi:hypothetical protein
MRRPPENFTQALQIAHCRGNRNASVSAGFLRGALFAMTTFGAKNFALQNLQNQSN